MNCCDYDCDQERNCPARVAKVGQAMKAAEPLPPTLWRIYLASLARAMLVCLAVLLVSAAVVMLMPRQQTPARVDCSASSYHPTMPAAAKSACRDRVTRL